MSETDRHVRRSGDDYADGFASLLPRGRAWPRDPEATLMKVVGGLAQIWGGEVDRRAADLIERETDPRFTRDMIEEWERAFGLPDLCMSAPQTIDARIQALLTRMTMQGGQSREFFIGLAALYGYTIQIHEYAPFMAGISEAGDTRDEFGDYRWEVGAPEMRFYWRIGVLDARLSWFRASTGEAGVDHHIEFDIADDLDCILRRYKPAHTEIVWDFTGLTGSGPMAGTP